MDHQLRRTRLLERLPEAGLDALMITSLPNVRYLTGFTGSNGAVLLGAGVGVFFTDGRYTEQSRHEVPDLDRVTVAGPIAGAIRDACGPAGVGRLGFESNDVSYRAWQRFVEVCAGIELVATSDEVEHLRWRKEPDEIRAIEQAQEATDGAFDDVLDRLAVGMTERQAARVLEEAMHRAGADGLAFDPIVGFGENGAEPHHEPNHRVLEEGDVITMDFGAVWQGYHTDMTRTFAFGAPPAELRKIHDVVREAQQAGIDAVRAGAAGADVDRASRRLIEDAGYGPNFGHGLGHGVGLQIHEGPRLSATSEDALPAGSVVTIEPGIYLPGVGGVRIEDVVEVTEDGCRPIPASTRELIEL